MKYLQHRVFLKVLLIIVNSVDIRCACRHCRFNKCVAVGMDAKGLLLAFLSLNVFSCRILLDYMYLV